MAQQKAISVENSFIKGLVTEATGLNFPEAAVTDTDNCVYDIDGSVYRRSGFDLEDEYVTVDIDRTKKAITSYLWRNVSGNGNLTVLVKQVGAILYFYETDGTGSFSNGLVASSVILFGVPGAPNVEDIEAQFTDGNGYLIVTHPYCETMRISYDADLSIPTPTNIIIKIRDLEGAVGDPYTVSERPTATLSSLNVSHKYNLYNQGWTTTNLTAWDTAQATMPSNADVMWRFTDSSDNFDASTASINRVTSGNTPAPNGHFLLTLSNQDRNAASGLSGIPNTTTSYQRPSVCAFFAGRAFYAGINLSGFNSKIYFTQIIENVNQYEQCYQVNDLTSQDLFDLLPSDGGVISIPEAGTIYKMFTIPGGLCIFAANGVWFLTGSTGLGFTASDYVALKIADISTISGTSFVNVSGYPAWWNTEGIYIIVAGNGTLPSVKSLTYDTFKTFYDGIPISCKAFARGFYNKTDGIIRWLYRSSSSSNITSIYEFDRVLNYNLRTEAFYPWSIPDSNVKVHGLVSTELLVRARSIVDVVDSTSNPVVDGSSNQVTVFGESIQDSPQFDKYIVSYPHGSVSAFTFADRNNEGFVDWSKYSAVNYESYFVTGFKLRGQAIRKFQNNWVDIYSRLDTPVSYHFQGIWDFSNSATNTGRWSTKQYVSHSNQNYSNAKRRLKVRGHGVALQFKVSSVSGLPFDIIGWSSLQSVNSEP